MTTMADERLTVRDGEEIWETTIPGLIWITTVNARGATKAVSVGGRAGARLRIATLDREISEENIIDTVNDPFTNGMLRRIDANRPEPAEGDQSLSTEDLMVVFSKDGAAFKKAVDALSEVNVRRMDAIASDVDASMSQSKYLKETIKERWPITSGDTPTYRDLKAASQVTGSH